MAVDPHVHIGFVSIVVNVLAVVAVLGTLHLLALSAADNRLANALLALGF